MWLDVYLTRNLGFIFISQRMEQTEQNTQKQEEVKLINNTIQEFPVKEGDIIKTYRCNNYKSALILQTTLVQKGRQCLVKMDSKGWFVLAKNSKKNETQNKESDRK